MVVELWHIVLKENCTGPSIFTQYVDEVQAPMDHSKMPDTPFDAITTKNSELQNLLLKNFESDSEVLYEKVQFLILLVAL